MRVEIQGDVNGQVAGGDIHNAYFGGWDAFRRKGTDELRADLAHLRRSLAATRSAFISHPSVPVFIATLSVAVAVILTTESVRPWVVMLPRPAAFGFFASLIAMVAASTAWVSHGRKPLYDGLALLRNYESRIEALLAIREAERKAGISSQPNAAPEVRGGQIGRGA